MSREHGERRELNVTLSVVALISNADQTELLLVQNKEIGGWGPPAGALKWLGSENRMETFTEGIERELHEETGLNVEQPRITAIVNLPGEAKNHIGVVYSFSVELEEEECHPEDGEEISNVRFHSEDELIRLLSGEATISRPEFNRGLNVWWLRNKHRDNWDSFSGTTYPLDWNVVLDERYLKKWENKPVEEIFKP